MAGWFSGTRSSKCPGYSFSFHFGRNTAVSSVKTLFLWELRSLTNRAHSSEDRKYRFYQWTIGVQNQRRQSHFHPLILGNERRSTIWCLLAQCIYCILEEVTPALQSVATHLVPQLSLQRAIPLPYQASCFRMMGNIISSVNSISASPLLSFTWYKISFLFTSDAVWTTLRMNRAFCKSTNGGLSRSIARKKGKSITSSDCWRDFS